jgi:hypothetical protein
LSPHFEVSGYVAAKIECAEASRMKVELPPMKKRKPLHAATVHLDGDVWRRVEQLAQEERRPVSNLLRVLVADAIASRGRPAGTSAAAA